MFIAKQLKEQNIIEYLLYMWQIEDLIRALDLDMEKINSQVIKPYQLSEKNKKLLYDWYESIIDMMRAENTTKAGHIQLNKNTIIQLNDFHHEMLRSGQDASYNAKFYKILPALAQLRLKQSETEISEIELCFNFLYGIMILRMQKKPISPDTESTQTEIKDFMMALNLHYQRYREGELSFGEQ